MTTTFRTLDNLTVEELHNLIADLQANVRYNDLKIKYSIPGFTFTPNTIADCRAIIAKRAPKKLVAEPLPTNLNIWFDMKGETHYGVMPNVNQPWTWTACFREAVKKGTVSEWYDNSSRHLRLYETMHGIGLSDEEF